MWEMNVLRITPMGMPFTGIRSEFSVQYIKFGAPLKKSKMKCYLTSSRLLVAEYESTKCWWKLKQYRYHSLEGRYRMRKEENPGINFE